MSIRHSYSGDTERIIHELAKETRLTQLQQKGLFLHLLQRDGSLESAAEHAHLQFSNNVHQAKKTKKKLAEGIPSSSAAVRRKLRSQQKTAQDMIINTTLNHVISFYICPSS